MLLPKPTKTERKRRFIRYKETPEKIADRIFSYLRICQEGWQCQYCGQQYKVSSPQADRNIGVSHFVGRKHQSARFLKVNTDVFCHFPCHIKLEQEKNEGQKYYQWKVDRINNCGITIQDLLLFKNQTARYRAADYTYLANKYLQELSGMPEHAFAADYFRNKYGAFLNE